MESPDHSSDRCPMCGGAGEHRLEASDRNRETTQVGFTYLQCKACETVYLADVPSDLGRYYEGGYYPFGEDGKPFWQTNPVRQAVEAFRIELLREHVSPGALIEIGAGSGGFSAAARAAGFDVTAIEMDGGCCEFLDKEIGVKAICSDAPVDTLISLGQADTIVLWHVLEHLRNPAELLEAAADKLGEGGILALAVPNPKSLQFRVLGSRWPHLDAPRHLALIPPATLMARAKELGLECVASLADDPDGLESDLFGWVDGLRRRPPRGQASKVQQYLGLGLCRLLAPVERKGLRGAAVTLVFRKTASDALDE